MTKTPIKTLGKDYVDPQKYKPNIKVTCGGRTGIIWSYISKGVVDGDGVHFWDRKYWVRYDDGTTGEHTEEEITPI